MIKIVLLLFVAISSIGYCLADEKAMIYFIKLVMSCTNEHKVETRHLLSLQKHILPDDKPTKCMLACAYKKEGVMDDKGMYSKEESYKFVEKVYANNVVKIEKGKKVSDICVKVNDDPLSGSDQDCERAGLLFTCLVDNAVKELENFRAISPSIHVQSVNAASSIQILKLFRKKLNV